MKNGNAVEDLIAVGVVALLAGDEIAGRAALVGLVEDLDGQHFQRAAVHARFGHHEALQRVVRLAAVGRSHVHHDLPRHGPRLWIPAPKRALVFEKK